MSETFLGFPKVGLEDVVEGTIALVGSRVVSKSFHMDYSQQISSTRIREVSIEYSGFSPFSNKCLHDFDIVDLGDFDGDMLGVVIKKIIDVGGRVVVFGGDHSTTYYALRYIDPEEIFIFDAHPDFAESVDGVDHTNVCRFLKNLGWDIFLIGVRGYSSYCNEISEARKNGVVFLDKIGFWGEKVFLSIDLDFFDATTFPAVRVPEIYGYQVKEFLDETKDLEWDKVVYVDFVEYAPDLDSSKVYAKVVAMLIIETLARMVAGKREKG